MAQKKDDAKTWDLLAKQAGEHARQRDHGGHLVRVDVLLEPSTARRLNELVYEVQTRCPRRLTRAEVCRHLLSRSVLQCTRHLSRMRHAERVAAQRAMRADAIRASRRAVAASGIVEESPLNRTYDCESPLNRTSEAEPENQIEPGNNDA